MTFKKRTGVLEVLFGVGFGDGDAIKRFVEDADNTPLLIKRRTRNVSVYPLDNTRVRLLNPIKSYLSLTQRQHIIQIFVIKQIPINDSKCPAYVSN